MVIKRVKKKRPRPSEESCGNPERDEIVLVTNGAATEPGGGEENSEAAVGERCVPESRVARPAKKRRKGSASSQHTGEVASKAMAARQKRQSARKPPEREAEAQEQEQPAKVKGPPPGLFRTGMSFSQLGLSPWLVQACENLGMHYPTDIQAMCVPPILEGKNVAGNAKTGSGKTACYCLPALHHLSKDPYGIFAAVLLPVRELAFQVSENFRALGSGIGVQVGEVVGGRDMASQSRMIAERHHVIIATPGRLADLLRGDTALAKAFRPLRMFVLDEADMLLTQTFEEPLAEILAAMPKTRQTLLFSATITSSIRKLQGQLAAGSDKAGKELFFMDANPEDQSLENLTQQYVFVPRAVQICYVHYLLKEHFEGESCIVFTPTIDMCQLLTTMLEILGFPVTGLHSMQDQRRRQASLGKFRSGTSSILIATDVVARGLDIPKVAVVLNVGLPRNSDDYVHRSGRTARAGRPGLVVSVMTEQDVPRVHAIEQRLGRQLELRQTDEDVAIKMLSRTTKARQRAELLLSEIGFEEKVVEHRELRRAHRQAKAGPGTAKELTSAPPKGVL